MSKALVRRLEKIEKTTTTSKFAVAILETNGLYYVEGKELTKRKFEAWKSTLSKDTELTIVEIISNQPLKKGEEPCQTFT
jgi:hypothetical protein